MKRFAIGSVAAIGLVLGGALPAQAGEINGNGEPIPGAGNASSICAFSGRDLPDAEENQPNIPDDFVTDGRVQSYGKYVSAGLKAVVPSPGAACRGNVEFGEQRVYPYPSPDEDCDVTVQSWVLADRSDLDVPLADAVARWLATD